ncbi:50S rRNA methyltransferase [Robbsia andropogonis]|uniref:Ribosomal RNA large subunit methyltransferase H n=1 Tax=Robbsia andropogonis TaxID=28092 RepID=A0A0F5K134_9BURK|nr:23S rRNA (pseudouridine(1915)-N(3))-methyltransferase RlmH [Robbsia andropogonis]KKB63569.1 50S rRNA methyltransferase [Robbsia andropogonis]MCP1116767.1 23S rRNA (pseudouridine(1915)-N(3))-methyltransferase RlmH [Robbsia andropogonis]MCP1126554.1 23S rRNA (pseudouridine(1915)-N(3))-methyltransferase RlmH [Robbsia andropogonis]
MKLWIIAVGHKMPDWIATGFEEYAKRMPPELRIALREIKPEPRTANRPAEQVMAVERQRIEASLPRQARIIALDERGADWTTMKLAGALPEWQREGRDVVFLIGGADGLDPTLKSRADTLLRVSSMTLPHGVARLLLAEQLYRAWTITQNHPYHRA